MKEYRLTDIGGWPMTYSDFIEVNNTINQNFPDSLKDKKDLGKTMMTLYKINGELVSINYRGDEAQVIISSEEDPIKRLFELKTKKLKLQEMN